MKRLIAVLVLVLLPAQGFAAASSYPLDNANIDLSDKASLQRGAKYYVNYCMGCHSLGYMRYNRMGRDLGLSDAEVEENLIFTHDTQGERNKIGALMTSAMSAAYAEKAFGIPVPDLTLVTRTRSSGSDWLYTYLRTFYLDDSKPWGVNNAVFPSVAMPHVLLDLQGAQRPVYEEHVDAKGNKHQVLIGVKQASAGVLSPTEYDQMARDITNFLTYTGEPAKLVRYKLGAWVLFFMLILVAVSYLLKQEYWRDVK
jgi:ubiquinol-cytochrome c reductase cytochrome c1 subunit